MQTAATVILETVYYEGERGWMVEIRFDGHPISTFGPYADRDTAYLWAMEAGKRAAEYAEKVLVERH